MVQSTTRHKPIKADHYNDPGYNYMEYWEGREYEHAAEKMALKRLLENKHFNLAVDIGGGYGRLSVFLKQYADTVILAEPSKQQLELAQAFLEDDATIRCENWRADALELPDGSVDLATIIRVMHHLPDPTAEFAELSRILAPDGYAVIEVANYMHARNRLKHLLRHKKLPVHPVDIRSEHNKHDAEVPFVNHNPKAVRRQLDRAGLKVERILSVSNLRSSGLKKIMPTKVMLAIEGVLQPTLAHGYFGPSVFFLVKKSR